MYQTTLTEVTVKIGQRSLECTTVLCLMPGWKMVYLLKTVKREKIITASPDFATVTLDLVTIYNF